MYNNYMAQMANYQYGAIPQLNPIGASPLVTQYGPQRIDPSVQVGPSTSELIGLGSSAIGTLNPIAGAALGFGMNLIDKGISTGLQQESQMNLMNKQASLNSPQTMMRNMMEAGINPAAAAQGIAGAPGAGSVAGGSAPMAQGSPNIIDTLANSTNTALDAEMIKAMTKDYEATASLKDSQNIGQQQENAWYNTKQYQWLRGALADNRIKESTASMLEQDAYYHGAEAFERFNQTMLKTDQMIQDLANAQQDFVNKCAEYQLTMANIGLTHAQIQEVFSRIGLNEALIKEVEAKIDNINMDTSLKGEQVTQQQIENDLLKIKQQYEKYFYREYLETGYYTGSSVNQNFIRMSITGREKEAQELMEGVYNFSRGQYGAKSDQTRGWINTIVGGLATVGGAVMMFVPGLQGAGAVTAGYGVHKLANTRPGGSNTNSGYGRYDGSWNSME